MKMGMSKPNSGPDLIGPGSVCVCVNIFAMSVHKQYQDIISIENLFQAWNEFKKGKRERRDVQIFERNLEDNLFEIHLKLKNKIYRHGSYESFFVQDPKRRHIHKATVTDRTVHHLLYEFLYEVFDRIFIYDSYSCRLNKGTHRGVKRLAGLVREISKNYSGSCWALKCDINRFFATVDHKILFKLLAKRIGDKSILWLLEEIINSFDSEAGVGRGIPLGNLTSQVFANIYLNELDQFVKHKLKAKHYLRYADDFLILSEDKSSLEGLITKIDYFLKTELKLNLHANSYRLKNELMLKLFVN